MVTGLNKNKEFTLNINNMNMSGIVYGNPKSPPVIALHGWLDNAASFEILARQLPDQQIIALDFIGHGKSSHRGLNSPYYLWDNVTDLYLALEALHVDKVDFIGHSMGASIAMLFAACFPEKVGKLLLIEGLAPLHYPVSKLPGAMAKAIRKRVKSYARSGKVYPEFEALVRARAQGMFPVSAPAARLLAERGSIKSAQGYRWSSDPALLLPSINRFSKSQIKAFLQSVEAEVFLFLATDGLADERWQEYMDDVARLQVTRLEGNHHLHLQKTGAIAIADNVRQIYSRELDDLPANLESL